MCRICEAMSTISEKEIRRNVFMKSIIALTMAAVIGLPACAPVLPETDNVHDYGVFLGASSDDIDYMKQYDKVVIDAQYYTEEEIAELKEGGHTVYSYINLGSIEDFRPYYDDYVQYSLGAYEHWDQERWMDVSEESWQVFLVDKLAPSILEKGVDGLFVDNTDVYYFYENEEIYDGVTAILEGFKALDTYVIINGGDTYVWAYEERNGTLDGVLDAVNQESVFSGIDWDNDEAFTTADEEDHEYFTEYVEMVGEYGKDVYLLEYTTDEELISQIDAYCEEHHFTYYASSTLYLYAE